MTTNNLTTTGVTKLGNNFTVSNAGDVSYTGPITSGDHITNKTYVDQKAAASKTEVAAGSNVTDVVATTGTEGQTIYTVNADGASASAGSGAVTVVAGAKDANNVTDYVVDLSADTKASISNADSALQTVVTQIDGVNVKTLSKTDNTANFTTGDNIELTADAGGIKVSTAANVTFTDVTTNNLTATGVTKLGDNFTVSNAGDVSYTGPITSGDHITNKTYVDGKGTELTGMGLNFTANDAIAGIVHRDLGQTLAITGVGATTGAYTGNNLRTVTNPTTGAIELQMAEAPKFGNVTINEGNSGKITGVTAGTDDNDAVNVSQLKAVETTANKGWNVETDSGVAANSNVKPDDTVTMKGDGSIVVNNTGNDITVGLADTVTIGEGATAVTIDGVAGSVNVGDATINGDGLTIVGGPSVTKAGVDAANRQVTNVASGLGGQELAEVTGADLGNAVNVGDLQGVIGDINTNINSAKTKVEAGKNIAVTSTKNAEGQDVYTVATKDDVEFDKVTVGGITIDKSNVDADGNTKISGVGAGELSTTSTDAVNGSQLFTTNQKVENNTNNINNINTNVNKGLSFSADSGDNVNRKLGDTVAITGDNNIKTVTTKDGVQVKLADSIKVNEVTVDKGLTVNEGATVNMGGNVIQNVGNGVNPTDAVNVSQVNQVVGGVHDRITSVENVANAGVAQAIATAGLPQAYLPGKNMMAIAGGVYQGETGYAIGFSTISDNGKWVVKATGSGNSRGKHGASIGAGYQW